MDQTIRNLIATALAGCSCACWAGAEDIVFFYRDSADATTQQWIPAHPTALGFMVYDPAMVWSQRAQYVTLGSGLVISGGALATVVSPPAWSAITGKPTTIAGYGITDDTSAARAAVSLTTTGTTGLATYSSATGVLNVPNYTYTPPVRVVSNPTRALNTCFQVSATRDAQVSYAVDVTATLTLTAGARGSVYLRTYTNSACSTGQVTVVSGSSGIPSILAVAVGLQNLGTTSLPGIVLAGLWARLETVNDTGTPVFASRQGQEVLL